MYAVCKTVNVENILSGSGGLVKIINDQILSFCPILPEKLLIGSSFIKIPTRCRCSQRNTSSRGLTSPEKNLAEAVMDDLDGERHIKEELLDVLQDSWRKIPEDFKEMKESSRI